MRKSQFFLQSLSAQKMDFGDNYNDSPSIIETVDEHLFSQIHFLSFFCLRAFAISLLIKIRLGEEKRYRIHRSLYYATFYSACPLIIYEFFSLSFYSVCKLELFTFFVSAWFILNLIPNSVYSHHKNLISTACTLIIYLLQLRDIVLGTKRAAFFFGCENIFIFLIPGAYFFGQFIAYFVPFMRTKGFIRGYICRDLLRNSTFFLIHIILVLFGFREGDSLFFFLRWFLVFLIVIEVITEYKSPYELEIYYIMSMLYKKHRHEFTYKCLKLCCHRRIPHALYFDQREDEKWFFDNSLIYQV